MQVFGDCDSQDGKQASKASLFSLIVITKEAERFLYCQKLVQLIAQKFPCKAIFLSIDTSSRESFIRQATTAKVFGGGAFYCDVCSIQASQDRVAQLPFMVIPQLTSDLPSFLLLGHAPSEVPLLVDALGQYAKRILFDTARLANIGLFATQTGALPDREKYVDLHWSRTRPWRETLARVFNTKEAFQSLSTCSTMVIRYGVGPSSAKLPSDTQAMLLQAWLADRLQWKSTSVKDSGDGRVTINYQTPRHTVSIALVPDEMALLAEGSVIGVELRGAQNVHYRMAYEHDDRHITVHSSSQDRCEMPYTLFVGSFQRGQALADELFQQATSEHYFPALQALSAPCWAYKRTV